MREARSGLRGLRRSPLHVGSFVVLYLTLSAFEVDVVNISCVGALRAVVEYIYVVHIAMLPF